MSMSLTSSVSLRFEGYELDRSRWQLTWHAEPVALNRKTFDLLIYLIDHRERVVGKEELIQAIWPEQFIEESNLTQHVFLLRKALSRRGPGNKIIETVPGRGYRFAAVVETPAEKPEPPLDRMTIAATESITRITYEEEHEESEGGPNDQGSGLSGGVFSRQRRAWVASISAAGLIALGIGGWFGWQRWLDRSGGAPVQVVVVPFEGTTGDPVLDKALTQALRMDLAQSPYVSLVPVSTVNATLVQMQRKADDPMAPATAREVCERTNSQSVLSGSIAKVGAHFLITEEASSCVDSSLIGAAKHEAAKTEDLPHAIDMVAAGLRQKLGESRRSVARFNRPLFHDNTPSLEALKAFTQGTQALREGKVTESIALLKAALAADPRFASAQYNLAAAYGSAGDDLHVREAIAKAYSLKDTAQPQAQFAIETMYDSEYTGDLYELVRHFQSWVDLYPNSSQAWSGLASAQRDVGMNKEALASQQRVVELLPHSQGMLANLTLDQMRNGDAKAAAATCERAIHDNLDGDGIRVRCFEVAYLLKDPAMLQAQRSWASAHPQALEVPAIEVGIATAEGRFADARKQILQIRDLRRQQGLAGADDERAKFSAVELMQAGDLEGGKKIFQQSPVDIEDGQEVLGLALTGDFAGAQADVRANEVKYPQATMWKLYWAPRIDAAIDMAQHRPADAAAALELAKPFETSGRSLPWLLGNAYLAAGQPSLAERNFRNDIEHPEFDPPSPYVTLSWLGLGEALAAEGRRAEAIEAYMKFLALYAHADPDATYLLQAKAELAKLQAAH